MILQVAACRLFDVLNAIVSGSGTSFDLLEELQNVSHVLALLIEVGRVNPLGTAALGLSLCGDAINVQDALYVPSEVIAVELDLQMRQAVGVDPLWQSFGQAVLDRFRDVSIGQRIDRSHQVVQRHAGFWLTQRVLVEIFPFELLIEVFRQVVVDELLRQRVIAVDVIDSAEAIVNRRVDWAGRDKLRQFRHQFRKLLLLRDRLAEVGVFASDVMHDVERIGVIREQRCQIADSLGECAHGFFGLSRGDLVRWPSPNISHGHTADAGCVFSRFGLDLHLHVDEEGLVDHPPPEFQRGSERDRLERAKGVLDANVGVLGHARVLYFG